MEEGTQPQPIGNIETNYQKWKVDPSTELKKKKVNSVVDRLYNDSNQKTKKLDELKQKYDREAEKLY